MLGGVILAAGASSRMGRPKALLPDGEGRPFVERLARSLSAGGVDRLIVVAGPHAARIADVLRRSRLPVAIAINERPERGQLSSLLTGLDALEAHGRCDAVAIAPVDQPLVSVETVRRLVEAWRALHRPVVRPVDRGRHGHPVILGASLFAELRAAELASGARPVIERHAAEALDVTLEDPGAFEDIDTPEDYRRLVGPLPPTDVEGGG